MNLARPIYPYFKQPNEVQIQCVISRQVFTVYDFWMDVSHWKARKNGYVMQNLLFKKDIINFLRTFYCGIKLNFKGMQKDGVISFHGKRPHEHFVLNPPYANHVQRQMPYNRMLPPFHDPMFFLNATRQQEFHSTCTSQSILVSTCNTPMSDALHLPDPPSLCCVLTGRLFNDPVYTATMNTFERTAIEDWLSKSQTDPLSKCPLYFTTLVPNLKMKAECDKYRASKAVESSMSIES